jgi:hypothetical protein
MKATVEEVLDEEAAGTPKKKKKKKPKKKKKRAATAVTAEAAEEEAEEEELKETEEGQMEEAMGGLSLGTKETNTQTPKAPPKAKMIPSGSTTQASSIYGMGGASLPSSVSLVSTTAQSARSYLKAENLLDEKTKLKSRPEPGAAPKISQSPSKKWGSKEKEQDQPKSEQKDGKGGLFARLFTEARSSTQTCLKKMFGGRKGTLKWDDFVKVFLNLRKRK